MTALPGLNALIFRSMDASVVHTSPTKEVKKTRRIALLGMPNTGKSTFFNRLTGASARVGNWPGITVDLLSARVLLGAEIVEVVDLPGIYSLHGFSEDDQVARHFVESIAINVLAVIVNATQLDRQLSLVLQLKELGLPMVLLLNMADDVQRLGMRIDCERLSNSLDMPVAMLSAKRGQGFPFARRVIEQALAGTEPKTANAAAFAGDDALEEQMERLLEKVVQVPVRLDEDRTARLDRAFLHPWFGLPLFFLIMYLVFEAV